MSDTFRLVTRSDFDGLVCAVLLRTLDMIGDITFVHPKDVQDGKVQVGKDDILTNLPWVPGVGLWFDHHSSEIVRNEDTVSFKGRFEVAPSAARVVYNHYGAAKLTFCKITPRVGEGGRPLATVTTPAACLDPLKRRLTDPEGIVVPLSSAEFRLLVAFLSHPRQVLDRDRLGDHSAHRRADQVRGLPAQRVHEDPAEDRAPSTVPAPVLTTPARGRARR